MKLILDSGGVSQLSQRSPASVAIILELRAAGLWPPIVPAPVLVECLSGRSAADASTNRLLKTCDVATELPTALARRCAQLRHQAGRGSAVDAIVVGTAEPSGVVLTSDPDDLNALATAAIGVRVRST